MSGVATVCNLSVFLLEPEFFLTVITRNITSLVIYDLWDMKIQMILAIWVAVEYVWSNVNCFSFLKKLIHASTKKEILTVLKIIIKNYILTSSFLLFPFQKQQFIIVFCSYFPRNYAYTSLFKNILKFCISDSVLSHAI